MRNEHMRYMPIKYTETANIACTSRPPKHGAIDHTGNKLVHVKGTVNRSGGVRVHGQRDKNDKRQAERGVAMMDRQCEVLTRSGRRWWRVNSQNTAGRAK
jgi:hypothetical protein